MSSMSHNNGVMTRFCGELVFGSQKSPLDECDGGVGGLKFTPHLISPLIPFKIFPITKSCVISVIHGCMGGF